MSENTLICALNDIPDNMILSAINVYEKRKKTRIRILGAFVAAVLSLVFLLHANGSDLVTAPGVIRIMAYDFSDGPGNDMTGQILEQGVKMDSSSGWGTGEGFWSHIPLSFSLDSPEQNMGSITFEVNVEDGLCYQYASDAVEKFGYLYCEENGIPIWQELGKQFTVTDGQTIYWVGFDSNGALTKKATYIDVVIRSDARIIGYAVIMIDRGDIPIYSPSLIKAEYYPTINGKYQDVTEAFIKAKIKECK